MAIPVYEIQSFLVFTFSIRYTLYGTKPTYRMHASMHACMIINKYGIQSERTEKPQKDLTT